jgi:hypothetical protein
VDPPSPRLWRDRLRGCHGLRAGKLELTDAVPRRYAWLMSVEELKKTVATLSPGEQNELTAFLFHLRHRGDIAYQAKLKGRMDDKDPSHWLTPEEFEKRLDVE